MRAQIRSAQDLGSAIRHTRVERGMSQERLASALGTTQRYISELEAGKPKRADEKYFLILSRLGIGLTASDGMDDDA